MDKGVFSALGPFAFGHYKIIAFPVLLDREVELLCLESGRCSDADKSGFLESR